MYRLLIVTKDPRVEEMFNTLEGWESRGFKQPRLRGTCEDAVECMHKHHIDAIAIDSDPSFAPLEKRLETTAPNMPVFEIGKDADEQREIIRELEILLNHLRRDDSNDDYNEAYYFALSREHWMKRLLSGLAPTKDYILKHQRLYRCPEDAESPCVYVRLSIPEGDPFITERWHYGSERLAMAMRNFFGTQHEHMNLHLAVIGPEEVRIVACPLRADKGAYPVQVNEVRCLMEEAIEQVSTYLGLQLSIAEIHRLNGLTDFAENHGQE